MLGCNIDGTAGETTSHPTKQPEDGCQVVGYSQSTKPPKNGGQVAGYRPSKNDAQVAGYQGERASNFIWPNQ